MSRSSLLILPLLALGIVACGDANETAPASASAPAASVSAPKSAKPVASTAPPSTGTAPPADASEVATEADFEDEAENDITPDNVEAELTKIEKELEAK